MAVSVVAKEGGGKTEFALTARKPITIIGVDPNTHAVVRKARQEGRIAKGDVHLHDIRMPTAAFDDRDDVIEDALERWEEIIDVLRPIAKGDEEAGAVVLDTATEIDILNMQAKFGRTDQIHPEQRKQGMGIVNRRYAGLVRAIQDAGVDVILLHRSYDQYKSETIRGVRGKEEVRNKVEGVFAFERRGWKDTGHITSIEVLLAHDETRSEKLVAQFGMKIARCMLRPALKGTEYWGREKQADGSRVVRASFPYLMTQVYPGTTVEEWQ